MTWPSNTANQAKRIEELETQLALALSVAENVNVQDGKIDTLEAKLKIAVKALKDLDIWQGSQQSYGSVYEFDDDEFFVMQTIIHVAVHEISEIERQL